MALTCLAAVRLRSADASGFDCSYAEPSGADGRSFAGLSGRGARMFAHSNLDELTLEFFSNTQSASAASVVFSRREKMRIELPVAPCAL